MHITEGFLPPAHAVAWTVAAAPFVIHGGREVARIIKERPNAKLLLAGAGAFSFVLSAIKLPSVTGSSSHPTGTGVGAILFRPPVMALLGAIVLLFQTILLAHGGFTTLGANVFAMAVVGPWVAYGLFRLLANVQFDVRIFIAIALANLATYVMTATQLALAFPDTEGGFIASWARFLSIFAVTQIPLAIIEGLVSVLLFRGLRAWAGPELDELGVTNGPAKEQTNA